MINIPAEELVVLSAIMNAPQKSADNSLMVDLIDTLTPEDFSSSDGRALWSAFVVLWQAGKDINVINLPTKITGAPEITKGEIIELWDHQCTRYTTWMEALTAAKELREKSDSKKLRSLLQSSLSMLENNVPAGTVADQLTEEATSIINHEGRKTTIALETAAADFIEDVIELQKNPDAIKRFGVRTGIKELDDILTCLPKGSMTVISGKVEGTNKSRGSGKTAFALQLLANAAIAGTPAAMISLEMSAKELACRRISSMNLIDQTALRSGRISATELNLIIAKNYDVPLYFEEVGEGAMTISEYRRRMRKLVVQKKVGIACIDYAQLMVPDKPTGNMAVDVMMIANAIKASATELNIPIIAVSQLSRGGDVAWSAFLEYNPHVMLQVLQPEMPNGTATIIIEKQRSGASYGKVGVVWKPEYQLFTGREVRQESPSWISTRIVGSQ